MVNQTQDGGWYVYAVGNYLNGHVLVQVDTLYGTLVLILTTLVEARHGVVEVGGVGITALACSVYVVILGLCVSHRSQDTLLGDVLTELHCTGELRRSIPTLDAIPLLYQGDILIGVGVLDVLGDLSACHSHVQVVALEVKTEDGAVGLLHQLGAHLSSSLNHRNGR